jgi:outer membrane protein OmpA-like peptidoglycan-associated protein
MKFFATLVAISGLTIITAAQAGEVTSGEIICALGPACARAADGELSAAAGGASNAPSINLHINFAYNSADILPDDRVTLDRLGEALRDKRLAQFSFLIGGHTDARGSDEFNQKLSQRRAEAVRDYLYYYHGVSRARLAVQGFGRTHPLDPDMPFDAVNRRVQLINMSGNLASK